MLAARKPEVDRTRVVHTGWRQCFVAQEAEHMSAPNFEAIKKILLARPEASTHVLKSLSAYANCPVEMGCSSVATGLSEAAVGNLLCDLTIS